MPVVTARVNRVFLNRGADLFFEGENVFVPFGNCAAKDLAATLDRLAADVVTFEYHTISDPKRRERDRKTFAKRLAGLGNGWVVGEWANKVVKGFIFPDTMVCTITRV